MPPATETSPLLSEARPGTDPEAPAEDAVRDEPGTKDLGRSAYALLPAVAIGLLLSAVDQLITLASYAKMGSELNALSSVSWIATSYFITLTSFQPLYGKLSDIFGRKECLLFAYFMFGLGCLGCGIAQSMLQLCLARAVAGVGGGGITAVVSILVSDIVPLRDRGVWQGYINIVYAAGTATGAPLGGILADSIGWRWSFIGQVPICLLAALILHFALDLPHPSTDHLLAKIKRIDFLGAIALVAAIVSLLMGLDSGSNRGWTHLATTIPLILTPFLAALFFLIEARVASHPFAPGRIILERSMFACYMANFLGMAGQMGGFYFLPLYFQAVHGYSATRSGALLVPGMLCGVAASVGSGWRMKRTGRFYWATVAGFGAMALGAPVMAAGMMGRRVVVEEIGYMLASAGGYAGVTTTLIGLLANATVEDTAVVVACSYLFRSLGSSIGVGVVSAVLQQTLRSELLRRLTGDDAREIEERVRQDIEYIRHLAPAVAAKVADSYQRAAIVALIPAVAFTVTAFLFTFWIKEKTMRK